MPAFATAIAAFTCCCVMKAGAMARIRPGASPVSWACNCARKRPSAASRPSCAMIASRPRDPTRPGRLTSSMTSWRQATSVACYNRLYLLAVLTGAGARFTFRGAEVVAVLGRACKEVGFPAAIRVDQGCEFVSRDLDLWPNTARHAGLLAARQADRPCVHRGLQRSPPGRMSQGPLVPMPCGRSGKSGGLAQILQ